MQPAKNRRPTRRVLAPTFAAEHTVLPLELVIESRASEPLPAELRLIANGEPLTRERARLAPGLNVIGLPYRLRGAGFSLLTSDHRPDSAAIPNLLTRAIGVEVNVRSDYQDDALEPHDRLLLCSDGVHDALSDKRIEELMRRGDAQEAARSLVEAALEGGGGDNATALVVDVLALPAIQADDISDILSALPIMPQASPISLRGDSGSCSRNCAKSTLHTGIV